METELRRRRINLITLGAGVIAFGVWSILKTFLYIWVDSYVFEFPDIPPESVRAVKAVAYAFLLFLMLIDLAVRLYIGLSARSVGMGKKKSRTYIILAGAILVFSIISWILMLVNHTSGRMENQSAMDYYVSLFVEMTSAGILAEMIYTALRIRKLEKLLED